MAYLVMPHIPAEPLEGPLSLSLAFFFTPPPSWPKWKKRAALEGRWRHAVQPDGDNLAKLVMDTCTSSGIWRDDVQVTVLAVVKAYNAQEGIQVSIVQLDQTTRQQEASRSVPGATLDSE